MIKEIHLISESKNQNRLRLLKLEVALILKIVLLVLPNIKNLLATAVDERWEAMTPVQNILSKELIKPFVLRNVESVEIRMTADERTEMKRKKKKPKNERNINEIKTKNEPIIFEI